jgi:hypothetical protein
VAYVYYDPDVLPASVKKWLPIQEPEGRGMSLEEYEQWRAKQAGFPMVVTPKKGEEEAKPKHSKEEEDVEPPSMDGSSRLPLQFIQLQAKGKLIVTCWWCR